MPELEKESIITTLQQGDVTIKGEFAWGSNYTFLAEVKANGEKILSVYKPSRGERPLWDFPPASLACRETAAYLVSEALGWRLVPPTVLREDAPIGPGSLQLFIDHDPEIHYFNLSAADHQALRPVVLFDLLVNNADRKASHLLFDQDHHLWLIDHGICFHAEDKLRTVIWDFVGEAIPENLLSDLRRFLDELKPGKSLFKELQALLEPGEVTALIDRARHLIASGTYPDPSPDQRSFPWPLI
jgi:uncharacterized repeat protein (TIGR03843 family)